MSGEASAPVIDERFAARVAGAATAAEIPTDCPDVVVAYVVEDGPAWWLGVQDGNPVAGTGHPGRSDVTLRCSAATAADLVGGTLDVQRAVADGRVRVDGDVTRLLAARKGLAAVAACTATVVESTT